MLTAEKSSRIERTYAVARIASSERESKLPSRCNPRESLCRSNCKKERLFIDQNPSGSFRPLILPPILGFADHLDGLGAEFCVVSDVAQQ